uniref:50S ribosomal protein L16, chloroplastic n=1 Tax=Zea diploperennis TaxID=4576 RepID=A0A172FJ94_ZEADI|nr:ribosomal protein L16 [Zea diploperennis]ALS45748.1 ribosomal protein L16 [Zea diploperennis]
MLSPKRTRFRKQHRGRMKGKSCRGNHICFGRYALQELEPAWIPARQMKPGRRASHDMHVGVENMGAVYFPTNRVTIRPTETRMGSGKGSPEYWVAVVKPGRILYEMSGVSETVARAAISIAASKMPIRSQFLRLEI